MENRRWKAKKHFSKEVFYLFFIFHLPSSILCFLFFIAGCSTATPSGNVGNLQSYPTPAVEAQWIRDGMPIAFEGEAWYPADGLETMQDSEVYLVAEHEGVQVFVDRIDVRPYERLYTKFSKNRFRYFQKKNVP